MTSTADHYGVFGHPVGHSLSPFIHGMFARETGQLMSYRLYDVSAGELTDFVAGFFERGGRGLNVTVPHKIAAVEAANELTTRAAHAAAAAGGAAGVWAALPTLPAFPAEIAAETLVVVGIEIKLIAELHEAYGSPAPGNRAERMSAYVAAWAHRRGVSMIPGGVIFAAGSPLTRLLRRRLAARAGRSAFSLGPLLTGAAVGAVLNGRETRRLGQAIRRDLRRHALTGR